MEYPEIEEGTRPRHRFMSGYEQRVEAADKNYQYLLFAAEPYEVRRSGRLRLGQISSAGRGPRATCSGVRGGPP